MIGRIVTSLLLFVGLALLSAAPAHAQGVPVFQVGTAIPRHVAAFARNGQIVDGSITGLTDLKLSGTNPLCIYDAMPTSLYSLCFSASAAGVGLISYDALGAAPLQSLSFSINGTTYPFPGTGSGNMLGPGTTTVNEPVIWNNTAGTLSKDGRGVQVAHSDAQTVPITGSGSAWTTYSNILDGITGPQIWAWVNLPPGSATSSGPYDTQRCVLTPPTGTSKIVGCFGAYVISGAQGGVGSIGYIGEFIPDADGASVWGFNYLFGDNRGFEATTNGSTGNRSYFNEIDFVITSPHTQGIGLLFGGSALAQPGLTGFGVSAISLARLDGYPGTGNTAKWNAFLSSTPGSTRVFAGVNQSVPTAGFMATFDGTLMTVSSVSSGLVGADPLQGAVINAVSVAIGTRVLSQTTPLLGGETMGGVGRYQISVPHTLGSRAVITGSDSQAVMFSAYGPDGLTATTTLQMLTVGQMVINSPTSVQLWAANNPVGTFQAAAAVIGSTLTAPVHLNSAQLTAPVLSGCGTGPSIVGTDTAGIVTMGTGSPTGCVITFTRSYTAAPPCTVTWRATPLASQGYTTSTAAITLTQTATSSNIVDYGCFGIGDT